MEGAPAGPGPGLPLSFPVHGEDAPDMPAAGRLLHYGSWTLPSERPADRGCVLFAGDTAGRFVAGRHRREGNGSEETPGTAFRGQRANGF